MYDENKLYINLIKICFKKIIFTKSESKLYYSIINDHISINFTTSTCIVRNSYVIYLFFSINIYKLNSHLNKTMKSALLLHCFLQQEIKGLIQSGTNNPKVQHDEKSIDKLSILIHTKRTPRY